MARRRRKNNASLSLFAFQDIITCVMGIMLLLTLIMCLQITTSVVAEQSPARTVEEMKRQSAALSAEVAALLAEVEQQDLLLNSGAIDDPSLLRNRSVTLQHEIERASEDLKRAWEQGSQQDAKLKDLRKLAEARSHEQRRTEDLTRENQSLIERINELKSGNRIIYNAHNSPSATCWLVEMKSATLFLAAELGRSGTPRRFTSAGDLTNWLNRQSGSNASFLLLVNPDSASVFETVAEDLRDNKIAFGFDLLPKGQTAIDPVHGASIP